MAADLNQLVNILTGVTGSGAAVTLIYNAAGSLIFQPSSNPAAGTELVQIKNAAGTVQGALSSDGKVYAADGTKTVPGIAFEGDKDTGLYRSAANTFDLTAGDTRIATIDTSGITMQSKQLLLAKGADVASATALDLGTDGNYVHVTGTTTITSIETRQAGSVIFLEFDGALVLTHGAALILQDATNLTTAAGDMVAFVSEGSGNWRELFRRLATSASGQTGAQADSAEITAANFTTNSNVYVDVTGATVTITTTGGDVIITFTCTVFCDSASGVVRLTLLKDTVDVATGSGGLQMINTSVANTAYPASFVWRDPAPTSDSHTYKVQVKTTAGTLTIGGGTTEGEAVLVVQELPH